MCDEPIALWRLAWGSPAGHLERGEQTVHVVGVVLHQLRRVVELCTIVHSHAAIQVSGDDIVVSASLQPQTVESANKSSGNDVVKFELRMHLIQNNLCRLLQGQQIKW